LAETLSETGGGKVLLVNLNSGAEEARSYLRGRPAMQLTDALEQTVEGGDGESESLLLAALDQSGKDYHPVRSREFDQLIPRLKASDFDYIVFDMPPLQPTSVSYRLSGFLDKMLIVAECEKTHLESLKRAAAMLQESNARVATVLNKKRDYVPGWLRQAV
jgi:Mrp family chromosome partitioning ATPase